jgi:hypothetical protein
MTRFVGLLAASSLFTSAAMVQADCSWRVKWPTDKRIWTIPWGTVPHGSFVTRIECEGAIDDMLREAIRGQALLLELPACVCVPGYDDLAQEGIRYAQPSSAPAKSPSGDL